MAEDPLPDAAPDALEALRGRWNSRGYAVMLDGATWLAIRTAGPGDPLRAGTPAGLEAELEADYERRGRRP